jgi:hypothetical protein
MNKTIPLPTLLEAIRPIVYPMMLECFPARLLLCHLPFPARGLRMPGRVA